MNANSAARRPLQRPPRRYLAVYLPTWATDRLTRRLLRRGARGDRKATFTFIATTLRGQRIVAACCGASAQAGVRAGTSVAHATALLPSGARLILRDHAPIEDAAALLALARWAVRFSPTVAPDYPDGLILDVTGCQRLYGGDEQLAALVARSLRALGLEARIGIAPTIGAAWAVARFATDRNNSKAQRAQRESKAEKKDQRGDFNKSSSSVFAPSLRSLRLCVSSGCTVVSETDWPALFLRMPIAALRVDPKIVDELAEVGIDHVGQLLDIPRDEIAARFDADLLLRIDQATGEAMEVLRPVRHEEPPRVSIRFTGPTTQFEAIEQAVHRLVEELCAKLLKREAGARRLMLEIERLGEDLRLQLAQETLTLSRPSRNAKHIWNLLRPRIERLHMGEGVEQLSLTARRTAPLPHEQEYFDGSSDESEVATTARLQEAAGQLVDLLESRLGPAAVLTGETIDTHIPEAAFRMRPASEGSLRMAPLVQQAAKRRSNRARGASPGSAGDESSQALKGRFINCIAPDGPKVSRASATRAIPRKPDKSQKHKERKGAQRTQQETSLSYALPLTQALSASAPEGRRNVATGEGRRRRPEPVVSGERAITAPAGAGEIACAVPPPLQGGCADAAFSHGFRSPQAAPLHPWLHPAAPHGAETNQPEQSFFLSHPLRLWDGSAEPPVTQAASDTAGIDAIGTTTPQIISTIIPPPGDRPTVLFDNPEPAAVTLLQPEGPVIGLQWHRLHRIKTAIGPERIGRRWWHFAFSRRQPARDYYRLQDDEGLWLWVYRSRFTSKWFVHGVWG